jgi:proline-specific peptidase
MQTHEGFIPFRGYKTWYRVVGDREKSGMRPLLCLHGGPGESWDYLEPLEGMAATGRRVIFYDQLGCGNSDDPQNPAMYTVDLYVEEVDVVRRALGLEDVHILGQSWGGMLAMEYALTQPAGLVSLILADTAASLPQWVAEVRRLVAELPPEVQQTLRDHEEAGTTDSPEYKAAYRVFTRRHICRLDPWPDCVTRKCGKPGDDVYRAMWGPSEVHVTGTLKDWDVTDRLGEIRVPTLVLGGRYDEATPVLGETIHRGIPGSEWVILQNSAHLPHVEETELYLQVLGRFLDRVEAGP